MLKSIQNKKKWLWLLVLPIVERHYPKILSLFVWKHITLSELTPHPPLLAPPPTHTPSHSHSSLHIMHSIHSSERCRDSGSSGFLISPSVSRLFEALTEGQNIYTQMKKPLLICFSTLFLPIPFHQGSIFLSLYRGRLMRLSGYTCALRKIPLLSLKLYYSAQGHDSQCF